ncbi:MAG: hypothetical protein RLZZ426_1034 [Actinomycetota bacterium]
MIGIGTAINVAAVLAGGAIGALVGHRMAHRTRELTTDILGLVTGLSAILSGRAILSDDFTAAVGSTWPLFVVLGSLLIGGLFGSLLGIEDQLDRAGEWLKRKFSQDSDNGFVPGFISASLIFCIGPLAIMGSFDEALGLGVDKLVLKSVLDFFAAIAFAASLGWGVAASGIAVGIYQGALTLVGVMLGSILTVAQIDAMSAVGGIMLMGICLRLLKIREIAIGDLLPALFVAPLMVAAITFFN